MTRKLVVVDDAAGKLFAVDPSGTAGVPIPAFRYGNVRPPVGSTKGEAFIQQLTGIASVWDGTKWTDIAKPVVAPIPDENTLLGTVMPDNSVALAEDTGNVFTRVNGEWLALGLRVFATQAGLTAATPPDGTLAYAEDTGDFMVRVGGFWAAMMHQGINVGNTAPTNPVQADMWLDTSGTEPLLKFWSGTVWAEAGGGDTKQEVYSDSGTFTIDPADIFSRWKEVEILIVGRDTGLTITNTEPGANDLLMRCIQSNETGNTSAFNWTDGHHADSALFPGSTDDWWVQIKAFGEMAHGAIEIYLHEGNTRIQMKGWINFNENSKEMTFKKTSGGFMTGSIKGIGKK